MAAGLAYKRLNFCVCGGGSLAHAVAAVLAANDQNVVNILTQRPADWSGTITLNYRQEAKLLGKINSVSSDAAMLIPQANVILVLVPHAYRESVLAAISNHVEPGTWVGSFPGFAGFAWTARHYLGPEVKLFGLQRVPYVCQKELYGRQVLVTGIRPKNYVAALPASEVNEIALILRQAMNLYVVPVAGYLNICFSRSNSVFHPARLYGLFGHYDGTGIGLVKNTSGFYRDWDELSSEIFFRLDAEMIQAASLLPTDMRWAQPLLQHYEIAFPVDLTAKIRSIQALSDRAFPLVEVNGDYAPDLSSYYFTEDLVYGLTTLKAICSITDCQTPTIDKILSWGQKLLGQTWLTAEGKLIENGHLPWPQRFGLDSVEKLISFSIDGQLPA